jgi:hypothetical protein
MHRKVSHEHGGIVGMVFGARVGAALLASIFDGERYQKVLDHRVQRFAFFASSFAGFPTVKHLCLGPLWLTQVSPRTTCGSSETSELRPSRGPAFLFGCCRAKKAKGGRKSAVKDEQTSEADVSQVVLGSNGHTVVIVDLRRRFAFVFLSGQR